MRSIIVFLSSLIITATIGLITAGVATGQPHGWPCDYGFRPGNTWFYQSASFDNRIYSLTVVRDSVGTDGAYWAYVADAVSLPGHWYRIDSACTFDAYNDPPAKTFRREFVAMADLGDSWLVDSAGFGVASYARIVSIGRYGKSISTRKVLYYQVDEGGGVRESHSNEWAEGVGIITKSMYAGYEDRLVGRIIDGTAYGYSSSVADAERNAGPCVTVRPVPAIEQATLSIATGRACNATLWVHDMSGRVIHTKILAALNDGTNSVSLDLANFAPGTYLVVLDISGIHYTIPLVVAR
jgi:hypothetical protein